MGVSHRSGWVLRHPRGFLGASARPVLSVALDDELVVAAVALSQRWTACVPVLPQPAAGARYVVWHRTELWCDPVGRTRAPLADDAIVEQALARRRSAVLEAAAAPPISQRAAELLGRLQTPRPVVPPELLAPPGTDATGAEAWVDDLVPSDPYDVACLATIDQPDHPPWPVVLAALILALRSRDRDKALREVNERGFAPGVPDVLRHVCACSAWKSGTYLLPDESLRQVRKQLDTSVRLLAESDPSARVDGGMLLRVLFGGPVPDELGSSGGVDADGPLGGAGDSTGTVAMPSRPGAPSAAMDPAELIRAGRLDDARAVLERIAGTTDEAAAFEALVAADAAGRIPDDFAALAARWLARRGEPDRARALLADRTSTVARAALAELEQDDRRAADLLAEVLAADLDVLGAAERHRRWRTLHEAADATSDVLLDGPRERLGSIAGELVDRGEAKAAIHAAGVAGRDPLRRALLGEHGRTGELKADADATVGAAPADAIEAEVQELARAGRRVAAIERARAALATSPDPRVEALVVRLLALLVRAPVIDVTAAGRRERWVLEPEPVLGRAGATVVVPSPLVSRRHVRFLRTAQGAAFEDLGSHNGVVVDGRRVGGRSALGARTSLLLGGTVPCDLTARGPDGPWVLAVGDHAYSLWLGPASVAGHTVGFEPALDPAADGLLAARAGTGIVRFHPGAGVGTACLDGRPVCAPVDLSYGDLLTDASGASVLVVHAPPS